MAPHMDGSIVFAGWRHYAPQSNTCFPGPTRVHNPSGTSIGAAVFAGLTTVTDRATDRQTDRPHYSVCNNWPHQRTYVVLRCRLIFIILNAVRCPYVRTSVTLGVTSSVANDVVMRMTSLWERGLREP